MIDNKSKYVIKIGENGLLGINQSQVPLFLSKFQLDKPLPKRVHELLIGYVLLQFVEKHQKEEAIIGFPAAEDWEHKCQAGRTTLDYIMEHPSGIISDKDVDVMISSAGMITKYQITRFVYPRGRRPDRNLAELIVKKCKQQQTDRSLNLVVSIEQSPHIIIEDFLAHIEGLKVPYGTIVLLQKASNKRGHFRLFQLFPKVIIGKDIQTNLPV